jgi:DEAD/DEAH box helicase domain-containing protein
VSVAVLYDQGEGAHLVYGERGSYWAHDPADEDPESRICLSREGVAELIARLRSLELVIGFNLKRFDYRVLGAYTPHDLGRLPTLDLLEEVQAKLGFRLSLQALGEATLGAAKSADGLQAVQWWREGNTWDLAAYCQRDVELTRELFLFGQEHGYLLYRRKSGELLRVPVDWSWESLRRRFAAGSAEPRLTAARARS